MKFIVNTFIILLLLGGAACRDKSRSGTAQITDKMKLKGMDDQALDLDQFRGKAVFINVWATWCKPCVEEMPSIKRAQAMLQGKNIEFLLASNEEKERILSFAEKKKLDLRFVQLENLEELGIVALPITYILNSKGELVFSEAGYRQWDNPENIDLLTKIIEDHD